MHIYKHWIMLKRKNGLEEKVTILPELTLNDCSFSFLILLSVFEDGAECFLTSIGFELPSNFDR